MNRRHAFAAALIPGLLWTIPAHSAVPARVQSEVDSLFARIESSGCSFYRNGTWHDAKVAAAHLRDKYDYLRARDLVATTEDFIERAATKSSFSGQTYKVKCGDGAEESSSRWLYDKLAHLRSP